MQRFASIAVLLATAATLVHAHFNLDSPPSFGFDEEKEGQVPCGGYTIEGAPRSAWYYKNGPIKLESHHDTATVNIRISYADNPTSATDFTALPALKENLALKGQGDFCFHADASKSAPANSPAPTAGTNATLLIEFISTVHGALYQCAAVTFVDSAEAGVGNALSCTDSLTAAVSDGHDHGDHGDGDDHGEGKTSTGMAAPTGSASSTGAAAPAGTSSTTTAAPAAGATGAAVRHVETGTILSLATAAAAIGLAAFL